jgi:phosphoglycerol transferase MdoB-like AlkP superfamily enzyme
VFQKQASDMNAETQPFFSYLMTLSSHEPFDVPGPVRVAGTTAAERFLNSCAYTDHALGRYFERVSKEAWFNNTLFVLCADHGHALPRNRPYNEPPRFHVPLLFYGPVLDSALVGQRVDALGTHMDIAATLLGALEIDASSFKWSNNLLNAARVPFAYYSFDDGVGFMTPDGYLGYSFKHKRLFHAAGGIDTAAMTLQLQAYLQTLMHDYNRY